MSDAGAEQERPNDAEESYEKGGAAGCTHAVHVGLKAGDEHEDEAAQLGHEHQRGRGLAAREQVEVQQINGARP